MNDISLLGGAQRGKTRPRGFAPWKPQATALAQEAPPRYCRCSRRPRRRYGHAGGGVEVLISHQRHTGG